MGAYVSSRAKRCPVTMAGGAGGCGACVRGEETLTGAVVFGRDFWGRIPYNKIFAKRENAGLRTPRSLINIAYVGGEMTTKDSTALPQNKQEYYVYLIQGLFSHITKIGISYNPQKRIKELQPTSADWLELCATLPCKDETEARLIESKLHVRYYLQRSHYEWFDISACEIVKDCGLPFVWHHDYFTKDLEHPKHSLADALPIRIVTTTPPAPKAPKKAWPLRVAMFSLVALKITFAVATTLEIQPAYDLLPLSGVAAVNMFAFIVAWEVL
jgi:hypothetical protein